MCPGGVQFLNMPHIPYSVRILVLLGVLGGVAGIDLWRNGGRAGKWREYLFLLFAAATGGIFGVGVDTVTVRISPDYFEVGKGVAAGDSFLGDVLALGFQAGFFAGAVIGMVLLITNNPRTDRTPLSYPRLLRLVPLPLITALLLAVPAATLFPRDPFGLAASLAGFVPPDRIPGFLTVWGAHAGLYLGAMIGTFVAVRRIRRERTPIVGGASGPRPV